MIAYEFVIKPILVRVCGESVFGLNYNNSLSLWNFWAAGPSNRREIFYFGGAELGAVWVDNFKYQFSHPAGRLARAEGRDGDAYIDDIRETVPADAYLKLGKAPLLTSNDVFFGREGWRFVFVEKVAAKLGETAIRKLRDARRPPPSTCCGQGENRGGNQGTRGL